MFWIAAVSLPIVAVAHRFACNMGYRYMKPSEAWHEALQVGKCVGAISAIIAALYMFQP